MIRENYEVGDLFVEVETSSISCGVKEIIGVATIQKKGHAEEFVYELMSDDFNIDHDKIYPFYLFSDTVTNGGALKLAKFIEETGLGNVVQMTNRVNPNTGNKIAVFCWMPVGKKLLSWYKKENASLIKRQKDYSHDSDY